MKKVVLFGVMVCSLLALACKPKDAEGWVKLGDSYAEKGDDYKASNAYEQAATLDPNYIDAYWKRAALFKTGIANIVIESYTSIIALEPSNAIAFFKRGYAYQERNRRLDNYASSLTSSIATAREELNKAIADFTTAIELDPSYLEALEYRAIAYGKLLKYEEALKDYERLLALDPQYPKAGTITKDMQDLKRLQKEKEKDEYLKQWPQFTPDIFQAEFKENEIRGKQKWVGKTVVLIGEVSYIESSGGYISCLVYDKSGNDWFQCYFAKSQNKAVLALNNGDKVRVKGVVSGDYSVALNNCTLE